MAERRFSCVKQVVKTVQIPLPATFISNEISGISEILDSWKRQYVNHLQGVVVNYKNYSLSSKTGFIAPNKPFVYYNVKATFDLFCPKVGDIVKGKIIRISKEHIGCLIDETINVTIHLFKDSPEDLQQFICLNHDILFEISCFNFDRKVIRVTGKITRKCIQLMRELFPPQTFSNFIVTPELSNNTDEGIGTSSESADDRLGNHTFDNSKINDDDVNFKKPLSSIEKSKKKSSKKPKSDSESSSMDTSDVSTSDEKSKKKKKKCDKSKPSMENHLSGNPSIDAVSSDILIQNLSSFNHLDILNALKEEESSEGNTHEKKHKKKRRRDSSPSLISESTKSSSYSLIKDISNLDLNSSTVIESGKSSKKRKRVSESSLMDTSEQSTADEMPKKKKKRKDKNVLEEKEIKNEPLDMSDDKIFTAALFSPKKEISSPLKTVESKIKKKKLKKLKEKSRSKKPKVNATGAVLKKDKKSKKKGSKKNGKQSKKHKKSKSLKKDEKRDKKKKKSSTDKVSDVIKSEIN